MTTTINEAFFQAISRSPAVADLVVGIAKEISADMAATAPVDTGDYRDGFHVEVKEQERTVALIVNRDPKTLIIQARTGHMVKTLQRHKRGSRG